LFRLNTTPKVPENKIVEFKLNNISNFKLGVDISQNINLVNQNNYVLSFNTDFNQVETSIRDLIDNGLLENHIKKCFSQIFNIN
jgi:hypothetical protein